MKRNTFLIAFAMLYSVSMGYTWQNAVIMGGGFVSGLAYSPVQQDLLYARTDVGGLYRWEHTTGRWIPLTDMFRGNFMGGESIAPDPVNPNIVYAAVGFSGNGNILRSVDQGNSWSAYPVPIDMAANNDGRQAGERLVVDPNLPSKLYFGSRWQGLWESTNSAANWVQVTSFPANGDTGYGISWIIFPRPVGGYGNPSGTASQTVYAGVVSLTSGNSNVYRSTNAGGSWTVIPGGPSSMMTPHASLGTDGYLWVVYGNGGYGPSGISSGQVWKLNTTTLAWTNVTPSTGPAAGYGGYGDVCVDPQNPQHAILSTIDWWSGPDRVFQTVNGGTNWAIISLNNVGWNPGPFSVYDLNGAAWGLGCGGNAGGAGWAGNAKIDPFNSNNAIYTSGSGPGGGGVWSSTNINASSQPQGVTWLFSDKGLEETVSIYMPTSVKNGILFSCLGDIDGMRHTDLTQSPSSGIYCNPQFSNTNCLDFAENNTNIVVRAGNSGSVASDVAYSTNNGQTWSPWGSAPSGYTTSNQMGSVAVAADGSAVVASPYSGNGSPAYATSFGGAWTTCSGLPSGAWVASDRVNASTFYATSPSQWVFGGTVGIYRSTDYGKNFVQVNSIPVTWSDPDGNGQFVVPRPVFGIAGEFWVSTYDKLYRFTNGGNNVTTISNVYEPMGPVGFGKATSGQTHPAVYLVGTVNGIYGFFRCDEGTGSTWTRVNDDSHLFGGPGWIQGDQQIYGRCYLGAGARGIIYGDIDAVNTATPTNTQNAATQTFTATHTRTATRTVTYTWTPTPSGTITPTATSTVTHTPVNSSTFTRTGTPTPANTATSTATQSQTMTVTQGVTQNASATPSPFFSFTATQSVTSAASHTNTPTMTFSMTATYTRTITASVTLTTTYTATPANTASPAYSPTRSFTATPTNVTNTPAVTATGTKAITDTPTPTCTATHTRTSMPSATMSFTATGTVTLTVTRQETATNTRINTATFTPSMSPTPTNTPSHSPTTFPSAVSSSTNTPTPSFTAAASGTATATVTARMTALPTLTPALQTGGLQIDAVTLYPCPHNPDSGDLNVLVRFIDGGEVPASITVDIYTVSFRLIKRKKQETGLAFPTCVFAIKSSEIEKLACGVYYCSVQATNGSGIQTNRKIVPLVIGR